MPAQARTLERVLGQLHGRLHVHQRILGIMAGGVLDGDPHLLLMVLDISERLHLESQLRQVSGRGCRRRLTPPLPSDTTRA